MTWQVRHFNLIMESQDQDPDPATWDRVSSLMSRLPWSGEELHVGDEICLGDDASFFIKHRRWMVMAFNGNVTRTLVIVVSRSAS